MEQIIEICLKMLFQNILRNVYKIAKNYDKGCWNSLYYSQKNGFNFLLKKFSFFFSSYITECDCGCLDSYNSSSSSSSAAIVTAGHFTGSNNHNKNNNESSAIGVGGNTVVGGGGGAGNDFSVGVISSNSTNVASSAAIVANNSIKTAHTKVATSGGHVNTQPPSKRSSSGADGDYQLVQHEVLYSLSAEYEVSISYHNFFFHMKPL